MRNAAGSLDDWIQSQPWFYSLFRAKHPLITTSSELTEHCQNDRWRNVFLQLEDPLLNYRPSAEEIAAQWWSTIKWREVNKGGLTLGKNENQGRYSRMIDYLSCMINQKYIFAGGMLGGREGLGTSHHDHFLFLPVFYNKLLQKLISLASMYFWVQFSVA